MTLAGWIILGLSLGTVLVVFFWCIWLVFTTPDEASHLHGFEAELPDQDS